MRAITRCLTLAIAAGFLAFSASTYAGECCTRAAEKAKQGKACVECVKHDCCKAAIKKVGDEAKPCAKCAAKKKNEKKS
jgi:hypothetical protein